tara:strand:- start:23269 stop:23838 length:570 start_codon:yes stop_codon:yes gene_type:complete
MKFYFFILVWITSTVYSFGYEAMHEKTPVGIIKILNLPERIALEASSKVSYFDENNGLFRKLFRYISNNDIAMTTPVEADITPGKMRFFVGADDIDKKFIDSKEVKIKSVPTLKVIAIGIRGGYTKARFLENEKKLYHWLTENKNFEKAGETYGVYWNGPFVPGLLKRSEIHLPIQKKTNPKKEKKSKL